MTTRPARPLTAAGESANQHIQSPLHMAVMSSDSEVTHRGVWGTGRLARLPGWKYGIIASYAAASDTLTADMINAEREHITICMCGCGEQRAPHGPASAQCLRGQGWGEGVAEALNDGTYRRKVCVGAWASH